MLLSKTCFLFKIFKRRHLRLCYFSYVWVKMLKKVPNTIPSAFDHFDGHPRGATSKMVEIIKKSYNAKLVVTIQKSCMK